MSGQIKFCVYDYPLNTLQLQCEYSDTETKMNDSSTIEVHLIFEEKVA